MKSKDKKVGGDLASMFGLDTSTLPIKGKKEKDKAEALKRKTSHRRTATVTELRRRKPVQRGTYEAARIKASFHNHICVNCSQVQLVLTKMELVKVNTHNPMHCELELISSHGAFQFYSELPIVQEISDRYMPACSACIESEMEKRNG